MHRKSGLDQRLQAAGTHDIGERPAWEWQEPFARSGGQYQAAVLDFRCALEGLDRQAAFGRCVEDAGARDQFDVVRFGQTDPLRRRGSPDLSAGARIVVDHDGARAGLGCAAGGCQSGRPGAGDDDVVAAVSHGRALRFLCGAGLQ